MRYYIIIGIDEQIFSPIRSPDDVVMLNVVIDTSIYGCYNFYDGTLYYFGRLAVEHDV